MPSWLTPRTVLIGSVFLALFGVLYFPALSAAPPTRTPTPPHLDPYAPHQVVLGQTSPKRVAVVGAGASGSAAAWFLTRAARIAEARAGKPVGSLLAPVVVYDKEAYVGGRSTVVFAHNDTTVDASELGAAIFVGANRNLVNAAKLFNLTTYDVDFDGGVGIWDGREFLFTTDGTKGWWGKIWTGVAAFRRYGALSPFRQGRATTALLRKFKRLYDPAWLAARGALPSIEEFAATVELSTELTSEKGVDWARGEKLSDRWISEMIEPSTRVNYASDLDVIHALGASVSLATDDAVAVEGGNWRIFEAFLNDAKADVRLNTVVNDIELEGDQFRVVSDDTDDVYDQVFFAAPWASSPISRKLEKHFDEAIPPQEYVHLHTTFATTKTDHPDPAYFGFTDGAKIPSHVFTTGWTAREEGTPAPPFQSISYQRTINGERVVKIFSLGPIDDDHLERIFGEKPSWVFRKVWESYPLLRPIAAYAPVEPIRGLHYLASLEPWVSTMETQTLSAREAVARVVERWWGLGLGECDGGADAWDFTCNAGA
ncbi:Farnesylcysteine lyase [Vanrija pseudolonga]|uniref:Farnesylcysteine lyase n=1 Tax=Vanrija pseudolonga TaxID=143232 RepID=A0AAF1BGS4_9TREE|nr:Farnesylcysteine lyase [Vanrija pseudolonga]